jgi:hypothetical protein
LADELEKLDRQQGVYGNGVRAQVFEVIVKQALAGAPWREICAGPMEVNSISPVEIEAEVRRRKGKNLTDSDLAKLDRESLLNIARSRVPKQGWGVRALVVMIALFSLPYALPTFADYMAEYSSDVRKMARDFGLIQADEAKAERRHPVATTEDYVGFNFDIFLVALLLGVDTMTRRTKHSQKQIEALTALLNREEGK